MSKYGTWTASEKERKEALERGETVLINQYKGIDNCLVSWTKEKKLFVPIDRRTIYGNPFFMKVESERDLVCEQYSEYLKTNFELQKRIPELKGKALACWCYPKRCHGLSLIKSIEELIMS
jgi:hypothetical protein